MNEPLDEIAVRVLGALMEKELVTPDNYPLTLNALVAACNQTSSRDPVMSLDEETVRRALERLSKRSLARGIHRGARAMRYREEMGERLHLHRPELAALSVLLLRGAQTAGEIRTRTARAFEFVDPSHVEITLDSLAALDPPLVTALPKRPGQKDVRYMHLLAGPPSEDAPTEEASPRAGPRPQEGTPGRTPAPTSSTTDRVEALEQEVGALREEVAELRAELHAFREQFE
ncbi:MAG: YceH family protein [Gemmatimonadota bacterium]